MWSYVHHSVEFWNEDPQGQGSPCIGFSGLVWRVGYSVFSSKNNIKTVLNRFSYQTSYHSWADSNTSSCWCHLSKESRLLWCWGLRHVGGWFGSRNTWGWLWWCSRGRWWCSAESRRWSTTGSSSATRHYYCVWSRNLVRKEKKKLMQDRWNSMAFRSDAKSLLIGS